VTPIEQRQAELEYESVVMGQARYLKNREDEGESGTLPGREQSRRCVPILADAIDQFLLAVFPSEGAGKAGPKHSAAPYLLHVHPEQAAYLTVRIALDGAAGRRKVNTVAIEIGSALQDHINLLQMSDDAPGLYKKVMEQVKQATSERHRSGVLRHVARKYDLNKLQWSLTERLHLGMKLIELFEESCTLIRLQRQTEAKSDTPIHVVFTEEAQHWFEEAHSRASMWSPVHLPMLVPPRDWTTPFSGGYLTRAIRGARMVLSHSKGYLDRIKEVEMPNVYSALNSVQRTPWRVNKALRAVMAEAQAAGPRYSSLLVEADEALPARPAGIATDTPLDSLSVEQKEEMMLWKTRAAKVYEANARRASERVSLSQKLYVAERFKDEEAFYFPHYLDFRGRIYPFANYLNPQGDDIARGLLEFGEGKPLGARGAYWLQVHIANLFGVDKVSFEDRVKWTREHATDLLRSAAMPLDCEFWTKADSPWQALAACFEFAGYTVEGESYVSHLPIAMDGSCSGLQHYSAMLRDPVGGAAVNLVPSSKPGDIYTQVAKRAQVMSDVSDSGDAAIWKGKVVRKIAKQPTMTLCYSATVFGMRGQIETAIRKLTEEKGQPYLGDADPYKAAGYMSHVVWDAIGETVVAAKHAMAFLKSVSRLAATEGLPICWTAPSGFPVVQEYRSVMGKRVSVHYGGKRVQLTLTFDSDKLDKKRQANGVAPNFVHSLDSAHLMGTVNVGVENGLQDWAMIHDSFGVHACDTDVLHACIREAFIEQYTPDVLARFKDEITEQLKLTAPHVLPELPDVPAKGTLDLEAVRDAAYFFA
jgi:DNA-directed RNA polymerase, mitochondrial